MVFVFVSCDDSTKSPEEIYTEVGTEEALIEAISNGENVKLSANITLTKTAEITKDIKLDLNGKSITNNETTLLVKGVNAKLTVSGKGAVVSNNSCAIQTIEDGTAIVNDGSYEGVFAIAAGYFNGSTQEYKNGNIEINGGDFESQEFTIPVWGESSAVINGGTFTAKDNAVIGTNGSKVLSDVKYNIIINGGTFNGNITSPGYIACGIYMANNGKVVLNGGVFNINGGIGILVRSGELESNKVEIKLVEKDGLESGKIGDSQVIITNGSQIVIDDKAGYPGSKPTITTNTSDYEPKKVDGTKY